MQIVHATPPALRIAGAEDSELADALQRVDASARDGGAQLLAHLAAACVAAQRALAEVKSCEGALPWTQFAHAMRVDEQVQACYARASRVMRSATGQAEPLPKKLVHDSAQLFRDISAIYARDVAAPESGAATPQEGREPVLLSTRALWCLGMSAKWTYFMHMEADEELWRACHALYLCAESIGVANQAVRPYREPELGALTSADVYVHTLLLGTLNAGNLSAQQIEIAHRWIMAYVRNAGIEASDDGATHVFHVCLDSDRGLETGPPSGGASAAVRFVDIAPVCARLIDSRESLREGKVDLGETGTESPVAVLDYGAFLDLAERFWSPGANQVSERAPRIGATPQAIEVVVGFDRLMQALQGGSAVKAGARPPVDDTAPRGGKITFLHPDAAAEPAGPLNCVLRDYSNTGVGLLLPGASAAPELGALIGYRLAHGGRWEAGVLVRRLAEPLTDHTLLGIKGISDHPILVQLHHGKPGAGAAAGAPEESGAIFAPCDGRRSRVDSLILRDVTYTRSNDFTVTAGDASFHVRLNRVLHRGPGWLRAGYQVLNKK